jgi:hypothetical protein
MSGGYFDYSQSRIEEIADSVEELISRRGTDDYHKWSDETEAELHKGLDLLRRAYIYAQRIDRYISGDDGEATFHERLREDFLKYGWEKETNELR